jgi:hypothetical protein
MNPKAQGPINFERVTRCGPFNRSKFTAAVSSRGNFERVTRCGPFNRSKFAFGGGAWPR